MLAESLDAINWSELMFTKATQISWKEKKKRQDITYLGRDVLVYSSCHSGTTDPDQDQHRQDQSCG